MAVAPPEESRALLLLVLDDRLDRRYVRPDHPEELHGRIRGRPGVREVVEGRRVVDEAEVSVGELRPFRVEVDEPVERPVAVAVEQREHRPRGCLAVERSRREEVEEAREVRGQLLHLLRIEDADAEHLVLARLPVVEHAERLRGAEIRRPHRQHARDLADRRRILQRDLGDEPALRVGQDVHLGRTRLREDLVDLREQDARIEAGALAPVEREREQVDVLLVAVALEVVERGRIDLDAVGAAPEDAPEIDLVDDPLLAVIAPDADVVEGIARVLGAQPVVCELQVVEEAVAHAREHVEGARPRLAERRP